VAPLVGQARLADRAVDAAQAVVRPRLAEAVLGAASRATGPARPLTAAPGRVAPALGVAAAIRTVPRGTRQALPVLADRRALTGRAAVPVLPALCVAGAGPPDGSGDEGRRSAAAIAVLRIAAERILTLPLLVADLRRL